VSPRGTALALAAALAASAGLAARGGALSVSTSAAPTFSLTLDGTDQTRTYQVPLAVNGLPTDVSGWNLTITSTRLSTAGGTPRTLPAGASRITAVGVACSLACVANPTNSVAVPVVVPSGAGPPTPAKFFNAAALTGIGTFTITPTVAVGVPGNAYAGSYTSTLTIAIVSGP
jgi:hypothetical protein